VGYPLRTPAPHYPYGPATRFTISGVQPPAVGYLGPSDQLSVSVLSPNVPFNFNLALRYLDLVGNVQPLLTNLQGPATGAKPAIVPIQLAEGFLLSAVAFGTTVQRGQCWVQFMVVRQQAAAADVVAEVMLQGYVSTTDTIAWPGSPIVSSLEGPGALLTYAGGGGGLATPVTITVPPGVRWRLKGISFTVAYSPIPGQANANVQVLDAAGNVVAIAGAFWESVEASNIVSFGAASQLLTIGGIVPGGLPVDCWAGAGYQIVGTMGLNLADATLSNLQASVEEYVEV